MQQLYAGLDLGGTYVRAGLVNTVGELLDLQQVRIDAQEGPAAGVDRIIQLLTDLLEKAGNPALAGIGFGSTGPLDRKRGIIQNPYTLPGWVHVPITPPLEAHFGVPAVLENDADVAALGEYWLGAGQGVERLLAVTVGTGIGTAFIFQGQIYRGVNGEHPEGGHMLVDPAGPPCYCGLSGCWESLAAGPAIARRAQAAAREHPASQLAELSRAHAGELQAHQLVQAVKQGDPIAQQVMSAVARDFALGLANLLIAFLPDVIVLGGGVMQSLDLFQPAIEAVLQAISVMTPAGQVRILPARLGNQAGIYGAAYAAISRNEEPPRVS